MPRPPIAALLRLEVDARGLDGMDRRYLRCIAENYGGGPVGVETMAAALGDQRDVIEEVIEPYLMQEGFMQRTPRGRMLTEIAYRHLDLPVPASLPAQLDLLAGFAGCGRMRSRRDAPGCAHQTDA